MLSPTNFRAASTLRVRQLPNSASASRFRPNLTIRAPRCSRSYASYETAPRSRSWFPWIAIPTAVLAVGYSFAEPGGGSRTPHAVTVKQVNPPLTNTRSTTSLSEMPAAVYNLSQKNIQELVQEMTALLGADRVNTQLGPRVAHSSTDWSAAPDAEKDIPSMIVLPKTTEEVSLIAKACHARRVPMIAFSGGTSLEGTLAMTSRGGVCIDFDLMNNIIALHDKDMDVVVQPGVGYEELNEKLAPKGLFFPPDPGPGAKIGGMISQGCSGTNAYRYGTMKDWVLGLTMVLADGTIVKTRHRPRKSSAGYNLTQVRTTFPPL
jgi:D-lactate dehydrogenase (cytochrome)